MNTNCGIYKITSPPGKIYIGKSKDLKSRFNDYNSNSKKLKGQTRLYNSLMKYGWVNHTFEIIEECEIIDLYRRERYWQDFYDVTGKKGLNCFLTACEDHPAKASEETLKRMSESKKGEKSKSAKKVICTKTSKIWYSAKFCAEENGIVPNTLVCKLIGRAVNNTSFIYLDELHLADIKSNQEVKGFKGKNNPMYGKKGADAPSARKVICTETGKIWDTIKQCAEDIGINEKTLAHRIRYAKKTIGTIKYLD